MDDAYEYQPLPGEDYIRLLHLFPSHRHHDDLQGELRSVRLNGEEHYESLSYTWGDPVAFGSIAIDGKSIALTRNCTSALRDLRLKSDVRVVWTDAVCINQNDKEEKGHEVSLMGSIYAKASRTVVYLGPGDGTVRHLRAQKTLEHGTIAIQPGIKDVVENARQKLLARGWFGRKWIIQEVLLSRNIIIQCGKHEFTWPELETLDRDRELEIVQLARKYLHPSSQSSWVVDGQNRDPKAKAAWEEMFEQGEVVAMDSQQLTPNSANLSRYEKYRANQTGFLMPPQLFDILFATSRFACKEPRDRIYALLSLFARRLAIKPSYTCDEEAVYHALTEQLVALGDTRLLWLDDRDSWKPRWATALDSFGSFVHDRTRYGKRNRAPTDIGRLWKEVYEERRLGPTIAIDKTQWTASGISLGTVDRIADSKFEHESIPAGAMSTGINENPIAQWRIMLHQLKMDEHDIEDGSHPLAHIHQRNRDTHTWFSDWTLDLFGRQKSHWRTSSSETHDDKAQRRAMSAHHGHVGFCKDMSLLIADSGLLAIAPHTVQPGDAIYFLPGYVCPFVALRRRKSGEWKLVALCWLGPLRLFPRCSGTYLPMFNKQLWETLKIV